jgi:acetylornithine deacetylase/succinyl-diaminopimelate desuccinylase-like protein
MSAKPDTVGGTVLDQVGLDHACQRLYSLLRIPSISTKPEHEPEVQQAAAWLSDQLADLGFEVAVKPTAGHPVVLSHQADPSGTQPPRIVFYGHYDVQPLELWTSAQFDPQIVEGPHGARVVHAAPSPTKDS